MCNGWIVIGVVMYLTLIPLILKDMWADSHTELNFIKWYFKKSDSVNWLGFFMFLLIGSGSFIYVLLYYLGALIFYVVLLPLIWLFEFLFLNKDCSHLRSEEIIEKELERKRKLNEREKDKREKDKYYDVIQPFYLNGVRCGDKGIDETERV